MSAEQLRGDLDALAAMEPAFARAIAQVGYPAPRIRPPGYSTLLRTIVGQQISVHAAQAVWNKLAAALGDIDRAATMVAASEEQLRAAGLSRQKIGYAKSLAGLIHAGEVTLEQLPEDDEAAIEQLIQVKGIGRWSAEIYLLFAEGRRDIWPASDLAVQEDVGRILQLPARPSEKETRALAEGWRPYRGAAAIFAWHHYSAGMQGV